jgi:hypothetical protein
VDEFKKTNDGRSAFLLMCMHYEGDDAKQNIINAARKQIHDLYYNKDGPDFSFK